MRKLFEEYINDFIVRFTYNSNAIEGSTLTLAETKIILMENQSVGNKSLREIYEAVNHKTAFLHILTEISNLNPCSVSMILEIHKILMSNISHDADKFKEHENIILESDFQTAAPRLVPQLIKQWVDNINYQIEKAESKEQILSVIGEQHIEFEKIHPFSDGNGRTGRMLINYYLLSNGFLPIIIKNSMRGQYILNLSEGNAQALTEMMQDSLLEEEKRYLAVKNLAKQEI
ncbi:MAG: Fic family protein [Peptostreptococcaceae bacterium]|nr:Fic family protein [Peptostreptococcaceae bacterium]